MRMRNLWGIFVTTAVVATLEIASPGSSQAVKAPPPSKGGGPTVKLDVNSNHVRPGEEFVLTVEMTSGGSAVQGFLVGYSPGSSRVFVFGRPGKIDCSAASDFALDAPATWPSQVFPPGATVKQTCRSNGYPYPSFPLPAGPYDLYAGFVSERQGGANVVALDGPVRITVGGVAADNPDGLKTYRIISIEEETD